MARTKAELEAENEQLLGKLQAVYDELGNFLQGDSEGGSEEDDGDQGDEEEAEEEN